MSTVRGTMNLDPEARRVSGAGRSASHGLKLSTYCISYHSWAMIVHTHTLSIFQRIRRTKRKRNPRSPRKRTTMNYLRKTPDFLKVWKMANPKSELSATIQTVIPKSLKRSKKLAATPTLSSTMTENL